MLQCGIIFWRARSYLRSRSRTSRPTEDGDNPMKNMILAAFAALSLTAAVAPAANAALFHNNSTVADDAAATQMQQQGAYNE
jgi:hypothetical protein